MLPHAQIIMSEKKKFVNHVMNLVNNVQILTTMKNVQNVKEIDI